MAFLDAIGDILGGFQSVAMQDKYGPDWRAQKAARDFALQQQQAEEERAARQFERQQEEADISAMSEAALAPEAGPQSLEAMLPATLSTEQRKARIARALGRSAQQKSSLEAMRQQGRLTERFLSGEQALTQIGARGGEQRKSQEQRQGWEETRPSSPRDVEGREAALERALAIVAARGGGGGGAGKWAWNTQTNAPEYVDDEKLKTSPPGLYADITTGRKGSESREVGENVDTLIQNADDRLARYEATMGGMRRFLPAQADPEKMVAFDSYRNALQSLGQLFGRAVLKDQRVSDQDRKVYSAAIGSTSQIINVLDPGEARKRLDLLKTLMQDYQAKYGGGGGAAGPTGGGGTAVRSRQEAAALPVGAVFTFNGRRLRKTGPGQYEEVP